MKALKKIRNSLFPYYAKKKLSGLKYNKKYQKYDIGEYTYGKPEIYDWDGSLKIGKFCSIAPEVKLLLGGEHNIKSVSTFPFWFYHKSLKSPDTSAYQKGGIEIGNDVWIGYGVTILSGVKIGHGAVLGACSVITKDVEPYTVVGGNPAKPIRKRFSDDVIARLLKSNWWDIDLEDLKELMPLLQNEDVEAFLEAVEKK